MQFLLSPWLAAIVTLLTAFSFHFYSISKNQIRKKILKKFPPQAAGAWPLIGHLFLISGPKPLHLTLSELADKYGPVFSIRLGTRPGLIVNTWETAKEVYKTNDVALSYRPQNAALSLMGYNFATLGFSNDTPYWREMRKISMLKYLSKAKVAMHGHACELETRAAIRSIYESCDMKKDDNIVDMRKVFWDLTVKLMAKTVAGDVAEKMGSKEREKWQDIVRDFFKTMIVFTISDVLPYLKWVDYFGGNHKGFKETGKSFDLLLEGWLKEHKLQKKIRGVAVEGFMGEMLSVADCVAKKFSGFDADTITKATCQTMMIGGVDTLTIALTWTLSLLLNNPHTLKIAQQELDSHIGRQRLVQESDLENLVYIKAIIKESLRLQPPGPVNAREAAQDCVIAGYNVKAGTYIFINTWKIQRDPRVWPDPIEFKPERFLRRQNEVDVQGLHFELVPFGSGRRVCPARCFAVRATELAIASFLHGFDFDTRDGVDMSGSFGSTNMKATPLEVCLRPRLSRELVLNNFGNLY